MRPRVPKRNKSQDKNFATKKMDISALGCNPRGLETGRKLKFLRILFIVLTIIPLAAGQNRETAWSRKEQGMQEQNTRQQAMQEPAVKKQTTPNPCGSRIRWNQFLWHIHMLVLPVMIVPTF